MLRQTRYLHLSIPTPSHAGRYPGSSPEEAASRIDLFSEIIQMKLYGSITENLEHAVASARRLRGHPVYKETLNYWAELLAGARRERQLLAQPQLALLDAAIMRLEEELADRTG